MDYITIANQKVKVYEHVTAVSERVVYGVSVFMFDATCDMWEYYMPKGTIREKSGRGCVSNLWGAFIKDNNVLLNQFLDKISMETGYKMHVANKSSLPKSVYQLYERQALNSFYGDYGGDNPIRLVFYANNQ